MLHFQRTFQGKNDFVEQYSNSPGFSDFAQNFFFVPCENILSWLAKPLSGCPDENFDGIHFHYKTTLHYFS